MNSKNSLFVISYLVASNLGTLDTSERQRASKGENSTTISPLTSNHYHRQLGMWKCMHSLLSPTLLFLTLHSLSLSPSVPLSLPPSLSTSFSLSLSLSLSLTTLTSAQTLRTHYPIHSWGSLAACPHSLLQVGPGQSHWGQVVGLYGQRQVRPMLMTLWQQPPGLPMKLQPKKWFMRLLYYSHVQLRLKINIFKVYSNSR